MSEPCLKGKYENSSYRFSVFRLSQELDHDSGVDNTLQVRPPPLNLTSPRSFRVDDVTDKLANAFSELFRKQWVEALMERNNGTGHSEKNLIYLADITKVCFGTDNRPNLHVHVYL